MFHFSQIDGAPPIEECPWKSDEAANIIMKNSGVMERIGGDRAFYSPFTDHIQLPPSVAFRSAADESCTRLHELAHASGAPHRLNRDMKGKFGSAAYTVEELYAEISSAFVGVTLGLSTEVSGPALYIADWLKPLKNDKRMIFTAAAQAQKIGNWILNLHPDYAAQIKLERPALTQPAPGRALVT